ncbi:hypothetical protein JOY44_00175 [Phormidium sp. CLA17]|uniref:hypothetical protein n=1 Tax=Leptolyngbya sp. Cla-17 TaxID=2803751 RepID=UPI001491FCB7|nr:hypothetical protein [Leptolyngbya sp. Cla-17]MBM0740071.1 hypothetical protein [Leptolyngbya sp. Cla-17]
MVPSAKIQAFKPYLPLVSDLWIVSQRYDLFFFIGSCVFTLFFFGLYHVADQFHFFLQGDSILITYFLFSALFDQPHIFQTFSRTHGDRIEFKRHKTIHTVGLGYLIAMGFLLTSLKLEAELIVFAALFGSYHIIRQHYGFLKAYKNLNQDRNRLDDWLDFGTFYSGMFACFFYDYSGIEAPIVIYKDFQCNFPNIPDVFVEIIWAIFIGFLALFLLRQLVRWWRKEPLNLPKLLLMLAVLSTHYLIFFVTATPFLVAEALETVYHDVQYHGWMMHYQTQQFPALKHVALKGLAIALLYGVVVGVIELKGLLYQDVWLWLFMPFTMIILYHYCVDGIIWKFSRQPELRPMLVAAKTTAGENKTK